MSANTLLPRDEPPMVAPKDDQLAMDLASMSTNGLFIFPEHDNLNYLTGVTATQKDLRMSTQILSTKA
ncbi:hypothetical protein JCM33374_g1889 [Metschnikowia sp. JCM 33374]|nr:hypothetical protein JCM33374_g1889 [Metschnikowia sp. JCM 33374]